MNSWFIARTMKLQIHPTHWLFMGLLPDTWNCGLRLRQECLERFLRHLLLRKPLISDPGMHHGTCVTHVPLWISGSLTRGGGGKRYRQSRRMRNSQFYVYGKRPMKACSFDVTHWVLMIANTLLVKQQRVNIIFLFVANEALSLVDI